MGIVLTLVFKSRQDSQACATLRLLYDLGASEGTSSMAGFWSCEDKLFSIGQMNDFVNLPRDSSQRFSARSEHLFHPP